MGRFGGNEREMERPVGADTLKALVPRSAGAVVTVVVRVVF